MPEEGPAEFAPKAGLARRHPDHVLVVLRNLRRSLLKHPEIARAAKDLRDQVGYRDAIASIGLFLVGTAATAWTALHQPLLAWLPMVVQLFGLTGIRSLAHEAWHGRCVQSPRLDRWLSDWLVNPIFLLAPSVVTADHQAHHRLTGDPEDPQDQWRQSDAQFQAATLRRVLVLPALLGHVRRVITREEPAAAPRDPGPPVGGAPIARVALVHGVWAVSMALVGTYAVLFAYLVPFVLSAILGSYREFREHAVVGEGLVSVHDTLCSDFERLLFAGGYFNLHCLHHAFPEIPQRQLPELYRVIQSSVDMTTDYYGFHTLIQLKHSYVRGSRLPDEAVKPSVP